MSNNVSTHLLDTRIRTELIRILDDRERNGGGNSSDGGNRTDSISDWKQTVETRLGQLHSDIKMTFYGLSCLTVLVVGLLIGLYVWSGSKFDSINEKTSNLSEKVAIADTRSQNIEKNVSAMDRKIDSISEKIDSLLSKNSK